MFAGLKLLVEPIDDGEIRDLFCYRCTCEKKNCLRSIGNNFDPFATIKHSRKSVHYLSTLDKENAIREAIISNLDRQEFSGKRIRPKYFIGSKVVPGVAHHQVCRDAFCKVYQVSSYKLRDIIEGIKNGVCMSAPSFGKRSAVPHDILSRIESQAKKKIKMGYERSVQRMGMAAGHRTMVAADWMASYFEMMGDKCPNKSNEIHLEPVSKKDIYSDYKDTCIKIYKDDHFLSYASFLFLWDAQFSHVRIREYKQVTGKCECCANLSLARRTFSDAARRSLITAMHAHHRDMYMGEREFYYAQRRLACTDPLNYMSIITDGMAQTHTQLPWNGNIRGFSECLPQHLQGVLVHGSELLLMRTFHNLRNDANVGIHSILIALERRVQQYGRLPDTIYIRIDGGSENANKYVLALCELLVARKLTKSVLLSRLPVGHTHEDIDGKFGSLWKGFRNNYTVTPQAYKTRIHQILKNKALPVCVQDLFAIPDYKRVLSPIIQNISGYAKELDTQLVWRFTATAVSRHFPLGVKVEYRAYSQDTVPTIVPDDNPLNPIGYKVRRRINSWHPAPKSRFRNGLKCGRIALCKAVVLNFIGV